MAQVGVMVTIPDDELPYLNSGDVADAFRAAAKKIQAGEIDGNYDMISTGIGVKIRSQGLQITG